MRPDRIITLITNDNLFSIELTLREYQKLLLADPAIAELIRFTSSGRKINMRRDLLLIALDKSPTTCSFADFSQITTAITCHVEQHSALISSTCLHLLFDFLSDLDQLVSKRMLFHDGSSHHDRLKDALSRIVEDYRRLLIIADQKQPAEKRFRLFRIVAKEYENESDFHINDDEHSHFELQRDALAYIRHELSQLLDDRESSLNDNPSFAARFVNGNTLAKVAEFFSRHAELIASIDEERLAFICALMPICQTAAKIGHDMDIKDLKQLAAIYKDEASNENTLRQDQKKCKRKKVKAK